MRKIGSCKSVSQNWVVVGSLRKNFEVGRAQEAGNCCKSNFEKKEQSIFRQSSQAMHIVKPMRPVYFCTHQDRLDVGVTNFARKSNIHGSPLIFPMESSYVNVLKIEDWKVLRNLEVRNLKVGSCKSGSWKSLRSREGSPPQIETIATALPGILLLLNFQV